MGKSSGGGHVSMTRKISDLNTAIAAGTLTLTEKPEYAERVGTLEYPDFTQHVNTGAAWLDEHTAGWDLKINVAELDLDDQNSCVLGQTWGHYADSLMKVDEIYEDESNYAMMLRSVTADVSLSPENLSTDPSQIRIDFAVEHGFALAGAVYDWAHVEAQKRLKLELDEDGEIPNSRMNEYAAMTWTIDAELWEQLTATWLVLIRARQNAAVKS